MGVLLRSRVLGKTVPLEVGGIAEERGVGRGRCDVVVGHGRGKLRLLLRGILPNHSHVGGAAKGTLGRSRCVRQVVGVVFKRARIELVYDTASPRATGADAFTKSSPVCYD
jgi:hypothetical protein